METQDYKWLRNYCMPTHVILYVLYAYIIPYLHIRAHASSRHLHEHSYASVSVQMNCFHMCTNIHMFVHVNANEPFSPFVPFD